MSDLDVVRHPRARGYRLSVDPRTGRARLTLPKRGRLADALAWAETKRGWIAEQRARLPQPRPFVPGAELPFDDGTLTLLWEPAAPRTPMRDGAALRCGGPRDGFERRVTQWLRKEALRCLRDETAEYAARAGVSVTQVAVGDPRGRWGSCSSSGAIRYSWRLILAPRFVRRATVAHEVAHRVHMNHGPQFHALVARLFEGDPHAARAWLRTHGAALHWYGCVP